MKPRVALALYVITDVVCVGIGMGVPILSIFLGFPVGWYIASRTPVPAGGLERHLSTLIKYALITSAFTFAQMAVIWGRCIPAIFNPNMDSRAFGVPLLLYQPKASFIAWLVLMILISPFLQLLTTVFASYLTLMARREAHHDAG